MINVIDESLGATGVSGTDQGFGGLKLGVRCWRSHSLGPRGGGIHAAGRGTARGTRKRVMDDWTSGAAVEDSTTAADVGAPLREADDALARLVTTGAAPWTPW
jgi:hypothetical protein